MATLGFKAFNSDCTNRYGMKFLENIEYSFDGQLQYGSSNNGFHFCENLEDSFRFFNSFEDDIVIGKIIADDKIVSKDDNFYGYYGLCVTNKIKVLKFMSREEVINYGLSLVGERLYRFIRGYKLTAGEIKILQDKFKDDYMAITNIEYYQLNDKEAFIKKLGGYNG